MNDRLRIALAFLAIALMVSFVEWILYRRRSREEKEGPK